MKQMIGLLVLMFTVQPMLAKDDYPLTIKVLSAHYVEKGTFTLAKFNEGAGGSGKAEQEHLMAEASDGNIYELVPENPKDMLLPGIFEAKIEKHGMRVCEPKDNGKCRDVRFKIVGARPTDCINEVVCTLLQMTK